MQEDDIVRVSHVRSPLDIVYLDLTSIIRPVMELTFALRGKFKASMLYYSDEILTVHAIGDFKSRIDHIFVISTTIHALNGHRVIRAFPLASSSKLFVRHNAHYLYYGTHTGIGDDGHHKWEIFGISLDKQYPLSVRKRPLLLENFHGTDIGSTVAFEIHGDFFYAVSNQGTFEVEEIDYTSFYHWVRFPVSKPLSEAIEKSERLYRRQHKEGPIHDSWTDLSLQVDERTNETLIVESRREWAQASSRQSRTFYVTKLKKEPKTVSNPTSPSSDAPHEQLLPDDILARLVDSSNNPNFMHTPPLWSWSQHPEFSKVGSSPRSFIIARTKFRAYNYSCTSFLDLVEDDRCCSDPSKPPCLRLRIGSRREAFLDLVQENQKGKQRVDDVDSPFVDDMVQYRHSKIKMWPPPASQCPCSKRLHDIINPPLPCGPSHDKNITGVLDERSFVYMVKPGRFYGTSEEQPLGTIVFVDFSRPFKFHNEAKPPPMSRSNSKMEDEFRPSAWKWVPGLDKHCRAGTCR